MSVLLLTNKFLQRRIASDRDIDKQRLRGGDVLSMLSERLQRLVGDPEGSRVTMQLMDKASAPYFKMLEQWIYRGK